MKFVDLNRVIFEMSYRDAVRVFANDHSVNVLGMEPPELKRVYRRLVMKNHPDRGGNRDVAGRLNAAYDALQSEQQSEQPTGPSPITNRPNVKRTKDHYQMAEVEERLNKSGIPHAGWPSIHKNVLEMEVETEDFTWQPAHIQKYHEKVQQVLPEFDVAFEGIRGAGYDRIEFRFRLTSKS